MDQLASLLDFSSKSLLEQLNKDTSLLTSSLRILLKWPSLRIIYKKQKVTEYTNSLRLKDLQGK